ncbi:MAG: hypothetical protein RLP44_00070 [Aggregatilineales bacterium]
MTFLQKINYRPTTEKLSETDGQYIVNHFDAYGSEIVMDGQAVAWHMIEEVEVVVAPHAAGLAGWIVKNVFLRGEERYHIGVYYGRQEAILPNVTWDVARYVVENIAYYASQKIKYAGPEDLVPLTEI